MLSKATFDTIVTHGDGSIGMQVSKPVGEIHVGDIITHGSQGNTLVKGVIENLKADALSVKTGGEIDLLNISGALTTYGDAVQTLEVAGGVIKNLSIGGNVTANGHDAVAIAVTNNGAMPLADICAISKQGIAVQISGGNVTTRSGLEADGAKGNVVER